MKAPIVVASVAALLQRTEPRAELVVRVAVPCGGRRTGVGVLRAEDGGSGLSARVGLVEEPGEIAARGGIIDIWPAGSEYPCRVELYGDAIESLRHFDPADQRSFGATDQVAIMPHWVLRDRTCSVACSVRDRVHERCGDLLLAGGRAAGALGGVGIRRPVSGG